MTILNKGAIPVLMTHGFKGNNINPNPTDIEDCFREIHFIKSDFGEDIDIDDIEDWKFNSFSNSYKGNSEYWGWFDNNRIYTMSDPKEGWLSIDNNKDKDYFLVEIYSHTAFAIFSLEDISGKYFDRIVSGDVHLLIYMSLHGYHETADRFYQDIIIKYGINPENITLQQESHDMLESLEIASYKYKLPKFNLVCGMEMEYTMQQEILMAESDESIEVPTNMYSKRIGSSNWPGLDTKTLKYKDYDKKFLSFNGAARIQRSLLVNLLAINDLLDKGFVSYNVMSNSSKEFNGKVVYEMLYNTFVFNEELRTLLRRNRKLIESIDSVSLDITAGADVASLRNRGMDVTRVDNTNYYEDSYFSVVSETSFPNYKIGHGDTTEVGKIISEKTFKCIGMKHPFILMTNPHVLKLLREIGYKTFHPLIDETYDSVADPSTRICMIVNEIKKLCELEGDELKHFLTEAKKICDYNYNVLLNKTNFHYPLTE